MPSASPDKPTITPDYQRDWPVYFQAVSAQPPRDTLLRALRAIESNAPQSREYLAIDIACGEGRDTRELLRRTHPRWRVMATDYHAEGVRRTLDGVSIEDMARVAVCQLPMEQLAGTATMPRQVDLINASFALPFCSPESFTDLWNWLIGSLRRGGFFAGQLFGNRDEWASIRPQSHFTREQALALLQPFDIEHIEEVEKLGDDAMGGRKYHHLFHIVARKR